MNFDNLPPRPLLRKWALYEGHLPYTYLAGFLNTLGYRKYTRTHKLGREIAAADVRRFIHQHLTDLPDYPTTHAPTTHDYDRLKVALIAELDEESMS